MINKVLKRAVDTYGKKMQMVVCIEEMAELQKELSKAIRGKGNVLALAEEIADVKIMLEQLPYILVGAEDMNSFEDTVLMYRGQKINRLEERLNDKAVSW